MYIKRFTFDGKNCFTLNPNNEIHCQNKKEICKKKNLYEFKDYDGNIFLRNTIEISFFEKSETDLTPFFDELLDTISENESLTCYINKEDNRECLFWFIASMIMRNPITMDQVYEAGQDLGLSWTKQQAKNFGIMQNVAYIRDFYEKLGREYNLVFQINKTDTPYITSDFPFILRLFGKERNIFWYFPLFPQCLVILEPIKILGIKLDKAVISSPEFIDAINMMFASFKDTLLISQSEKTLEKLKNWRTKK